MSTNKRPHEKETPIASNKKARMEKSKNDFIILKNNSATAESKCFIINASDIPEEGNLRFLYDGCNQKDGIVEINEGFDNKLFKIAIESIDPSFSMVCGRCKFVLNFQEFEEIRKIYEFFGLDTGELNSILMLDSFYTNTFSSHSSLYSRAQQKHTLNLFVSDPRKNEISLDFHLNYPDETSVSLTNIYTFTEGETDDTWNIMIDHFTSIIINIKNQKFVLIKKENTEDAKQNIVFSTNMTSTPRLLDFDSDPIKILYR